MAVLSGKDGKVVYDGGGGDTTIADITDWKFHTKAANVAYASSSTSGFTKRLAGIKDGAGNVTGKVQDDAVPDLAAGAAVTMKLYIDATHFYTVPAVIDEFQLQVDVATGKVEAWTADFSTDGAWTEPSF